MAHLFVCENQEKLYHIRKFASHSDAKLKNTKIENH